MIYMHILQSMLRNNSGNIQNLCFRNFIKMWSLKLLICLVISVGAMARSVNIKEKITVLEARAAELLEVVYPGDEEVRFGEELTPAEASSTPQVKWDADPEKYYVLAMVDPDAPSRDDPSVSEVEHWLVVNIKGSDLSTGEVFANYIGPGPPVGSGLHRYIFLVFEETERQIFDINDSSANRLNFSIAKFAEKYNLGTPIAENFFYAEYQYVEK